MHRIQTWLLVCAALALACSGAPSSEAPVGTQRAALEDSRVPDAIPFESWKEPIYPEAKRAAVITAASPDDDSKFRSYVVNLETEQIVLVLDGALTDYPFFASRVASEQVERRPSCLIAAGQITIPPPMPVGPRGEIVRRAMNVAADNCTQ